MRAYRERQREGVLMVAKVPVRADLIEALLAAGFDERAALDPCCVSREISRVLQQWVEHWRQQSR